VTITAPYVDTSATYGPTFSGPSSITAPFVDGGVGFGPSFTTTTTSSLAVYNGATLLDQSFERSFQDDLTGAGSFSLTLHNDDPDMPAYEDVLRFRINGTTRFAGVVEQKTITTHGDGDNHAKVTHVSGRGTLALLDQGAVEPARRQQHAGLLEQLPEGRGPGRTGLGRALDRDLGVLRVYRTARQRDTDEIVCLHEIRSYLEAVLEMSYQSIGYRRVKTPRIWSLHDLTALDLRR